VREGEGRNDGRDVEQRRAEARDLSPASVLAREHGGQEQREQEEYVVEAEPDVPHALVPVLTERREAAGRADLDVRAFGREHGRLRRAVLLRTQEPAVRGVEVEEQRVVDSERRGRACEREAEDGVGAVAVAVDLQAGRCRHAARAGGRRAEA
jgi:hypothetical protein